MNISLAMVNIVCPIFKTTSCFSKTPVAMLVYDNFFTVNSIVSFIAKVAELTIRLKSTLLWAGSGPPGDSAPLWLGKACVSQPQLWKGIILSWSLVHKMM
jgi:hypothetical protein